MFTAFVMNKKSICWNVDELDKYCSNKDLLKLMFTDFIRIDDKEKRLIENENQNLIRPEILKIFKNVTGLTIDCKYYPLSLEALLC